MSREPIVWERFEWRSGADQYRFEITDGGLIGTLTGPGTKSHSLAIVAWEGLLESLKVNRKSKDKASSELNVRAGSRWSPAEIGALEQGVATGRSIQQLAGAHGRTAFAVETQLAKMGLWDRELRLPVSSPRSPGYGPDIPGLNAGSAAGVTPAAASAWHPASPVAPSPAKGGSVAQKPATSDGEPTLDDDEFARRFGS